MGLTETEDEIFRVHLQHAMLLSEQGDQARALVACQDALDFWKQHAAKDAVAPAYPYREAFYQVSAARILSREGKFDDALVLYRKVIMLWRPIEEQDKRTPNNVSSAASLYRGMAEALAAKNDNEEAVSTLRKALPAMQEIVGRDPANARWQGELAALLLRLGQILTKSDSLTESKEKLFEARDIFVRLQGHAMLTREQTGWLAETEGELQAIPRN